MEKFSTELTGAQTEALKLQKQATEEKSTEIKHDELEPWLEEMYQKFKNRPNALEIQKDSFAKKLEELRALIDSHQIDCILGDDKSGRIPALVISKCINTIYTSRSENAIPTLFIDPHKYKYINGWGNLYAHKTTENEEPINQASKNIDHKISDLFENANLSGDTILLVSDFIDTNATVRAFKEMAEKNNFKMVTLFDDSWHSASSGGNPSIGDHHGLAPNDDFGNLEPSIHAKSLWKEIGDDKLSDKEKIKLIKACVGELQGPGFVWTEILLSIKKEVDDSIPVSVIEKSIKTKGYGEKTIENLLTNELNSEQIQNFYSCIKKRYFQNIRHDIPDFAKKLAREYLEK
jgi:adenine/guanine phosphoribosyltransferase-like PRPP-binding protein